MLNEAAPRAIGFCDKIRYSEFQQEIDGVFAQLGSVFDIGGIVNTR